MKKSFGAILAIALTFSTAAFSQDESETEKLIKHWQEVSVTVKSESRWSRGEGSGVIVTRKLKDKNGEEHTVNFIWTAGHVIDNLRTVREVIDPKTGTERKVITFAAPHIVQELRDETGRRIGEIKLETKVLCYSDADTGEDLALLMILKRNFVKAGARFYLGKKTLGMGTYICHVGSRHGQFGAGSFSSGRVSAVGRILPSVSNKEFDQTSVPASPGSSGGGVFVEKGASKGKCLGLLVRGGESTFNLIVPVRRMRNWAEKMNVLFALDENVTPPSLEDLSKITIEDGWINSKAEEKTSVAKPYKLDKKVKRSKIGSKAESKFRKLHIREEKKLLEKKSPLEQIKEFKALSSDN